MHRSDLDGTTVCFFGCGQAGLNGRNGVVSRRSGTRPISAGHAEISISQNLPSHPSSQWRQWVDCCRATTRTFGYSERSSGDCSADEENAKLTAKAIDAMPEKKMAKMGDQSVQAWGGQKGLRQHKRPLSRR